MVLRGQIAGARRGGVLQGLVGFLLDHIAVVVFLVGREGDSSMG
jgi:hypothetical protein